MQADYCTVLNRSSAPVGGVCAKKIDGGIRFTPPKQLEEAGFPITEQTISIGPYLSESSPDAVYNDFLKDTGKHFGAEEGKAFNTVVFSYGSRGVPKRQWMFFSGGYVEKVLSDALKKKRDGTRYFLSCYLMGVTENLIDALNPENVQGLVVESVKDGPRVRYIESVEVSDKGELKPLFKKIQACIQNKLGPVLGDGASNEAVALPPYDPTCVVLTLKRYNTAEDLEADVENNSLTFIALGDSERPALCGIDAEQLQQYERSQRGLSAVVAIFQAIRNNRLRIPFGKSKLSQLLKRAYNNERTNPNNAKNQPTRSLLLLHAFDDERNAEETFHTLSIAKRLTSGLNTLMGLPTRDLAVDKWRLEQDMMELKDELLVAKQVFEYKPTIYDQPKPVQNILEEETKKIQAILKRREEAREKMVQAAKAKAMEESGKIIADEEKNSKVTIAGLEKAIQTLRGENAAKQSERAKTVKEYEKKLEKLQQKKEEEEKKLTALSDELANLQENMANRQAAVEKKRRQLVITTQDKEQIKRTVAEERKELDAQRKKVEKERRAQREQWIEQIQKANEDLLNLVRHLVKERAALHKLEEELGVPSAPVKEEETEAQVQEDIQSVDQYLPKLISLDDNPVDVEATESIRKQLEEYFALERTAYLSRLETEKARQTELEKEVESFRSRLCENQSSVLKDQLADVSKKNQHLQSLFEQVLQYLCNGVRMTKVNSQKKIRRRLYFISEDLRKLHSCELDESSSPISRHKPPFTLPLRDISKILRGCYASSFVSYAGETQLEKQREASMKESGSYNPDPTPPITPQNLGAYNYRSFALFYKGKTLELVCDSDSDCEAWLLALKRLLNCKTPAEAAREARRRSSAPDPYAIPEAQAKMSFGARLNVANRQGVGLLDADETTLCAEQHIPPALYLKIKEELREKSQTAIITVYDIRVGYALDLLRSQACYDLLVAKNVFPDPSAFTQESSSS